MEERGSRRVVHGGEMGLALATEGSSVYDRASALLFCVIKFCHRRQRS
ncbi:hypothetical protein RchiOBHm_Chr7g0206071 [Rosa chinensis]|uniref:Uncharacterized protein n=1 Tax=Rosa chinensis TaxID=74649 RepID=A0A2P6P929_ROSCH|nr:hypothetical protein RchiOBHm_Chr7g0206071 [Rosa chinensis]